MGVKIAKGTGAGLTVELASAHITKEAEFRVGSDYLARVFCSEWHSPGYSKIPGTGEIRIQWKKQTTNGDYRQLSSNRPTPPDLVKMEAELTRLALAQWRKL